MSIEMPIEVSRLAVFHFALFVMNVVGFFSNHSAGEASISALAAALAMLTAIGIVRAARMIRALVWLNGIGAMATAGFGLLMMSYILTQIGGKLSFQHYVNVGFSVGINLAFLVLGFLSIKYVRSKATSTYFEAMQRRRQLS